MAAFQNSEEFGTFIDAVRSLISASRKGVEDGGGPSVRQQADVESGKDMPITARTCGQYSNFLHEWGRRSVTPQFFEAACAVFAGVQTTPKLGWDDAVLGPGGGFMLGCLANPGSVITAGSLTFPNEATTAHWFADHLAGRNGATKAFIRAASQIASRHNVITVMPWPVAVSNNFTDGGPWSSIYTYRIGVPANNGFPRILMDPLCDIDDLESAYLRAGALGAAGADRTHLAWAILLANGVAAQSDTSPLRAWMKLFAPDNGERPGSDTHMSDREKWERLPERLKWRRLLDQIHSDTGMTTTVTVDRVVQEAQPYLLRWTEDLLAASGLRFSSFAGSGGAAEVKWGLNNADCRSVEWDPDSKSNALKSQLWFCDPALVPALPAILKDRNTGNLLLDDTALTATGSQHPQFTWCAIGASERHVLLHNADTDQWRPALLF